ncbi:MAG: 1-acyl-sn-glycerol-3-phosphate acyltransferase [Bacteroidaceae bacterium]|nr:1-acyl-sn-glycerol-3-phosphate acyltransferase [Bacteroidaceae bacterium]
MNYDSIRSYNPDELQGVYSRLLADPMFCQMLGYVMPDMTMADIEKTMRNCKTNLEFQRAFCYRFLLDLLQKASKGLKVDFNSISTANRYTFISNHRDIVMDPALLSLVILEAGFQTTCEIAIGDNLLAWPWVEDLVRTMKSFIVRRGLSMREQLVASQTLSAYMYHVITDKKDNLWIAQREGRAKDSDDRTHPAVLKMMAMIGKKDVISHLKAMHISPLAISYEYDPCDILKAQEALLKRNNPEWQKSKSDDVNSMITGILGYKGHITYRATTCLDEFLETLRDVPNTEVFDRIAAQIDKQIHSAYDLFPINYVALDRLNGKKDYLNNGYTAEEEQQVNNYLESKMQKVNVSDADREFLMDNILTMYANPLKNHVEAKSEE